MMCARDHSIQTKRHKRLQQQQRRWVGGGDVEMGCGNGGGGDPVVEAAEVAMSSPETDSSFLNPVTLSLSSRCPQNPSHPKPKPPSQPQVSSSNAHCMHHPQSLRKTLTPKPTLAAASSTLQPFHPSTFQTFNPSTLQSFNPSPFHPFNPSTIQPFKHSTLRPFNPSTLPPFKPSTLSINLSTLLVLVPSQI